MKDAEQLASSNPLRITTVVSLCEEDVVHRASTVTYVHLAISDSRPISTGRFDSIIAAIADGVRRGYLLLHCMGGSSRSPILLAAWMHRCGYAGIDKGLAEISQLRDIDPSPILLKSVKEKLCR